MPIPSILCFNLEVYVFINLYTCLSPSSILLMLKAITTTHYTSVCVDVKQIFFPFFFNTFNKKTVLHESKVLHELVHKMKCSNWFSYTVIKQRHSELFQNILSFFPHIRWTKKFYMYIKLNTQTDSVTLLSSRDISHCSFLFSTHSIKKMFYVYLKWKTRTDSVILLSSRDISNCAWKRRRQEKGGMSNFKVFKIN